MPRVIEHIIAIAAEAAMSDISPSKWLQSAAKKVSFLTDDKWPSRIAFRLFLVIANESKYLQMGIERVASIIFTRSGSRDVDARKSIDDQPRKGLFKWKASV